MNESKISVGYLTPIISINSSTTMFSEYAKSLVTFQPFNISTKTNSTTTIF